MERVIAIVTTIIVWFHVVSHFAIFVCDYTQWVPLIDFVTRHDGSASTPEDLLPLELIYAGVTSMAFSTVGLAYLLAAIHWADVEVAAALSAWFHGLWVVHMMQFWDSWTGMMHPGSAMTPQFFYSMHKIWTCLSLLILVLQPTTAAEHPPSSSSLPSGQQAHKHDE